MKNEKVIPNKNNLFPMNRFTKPSNIHQNATIPIKMDTFNKMDSKNTLFTKIGKNVLKAKIKSQTKNIL